MSLWVEEYLVDNVTMTHGRTFQYNVVSQQNKKTDLLFSEEF